MHPSLREEVQPAAHHLLSSQPLAGAPFVALTWSLCCEIWLVKGLRGLCVYTPSRPARCHCSAASPDGAPSKACLQHVKSKFLVRLLLMHTRRADLPRNKEREAADDSPGLCSLLLTTQSFLPLQPAGQCTQYGQICCRVCGLDRCAEVGLVSSSGQPLLLLPTCNAMLVCLSAVVKYARPSSDTLVGTGCMASRCAMAVRMSVCTWRMVLNASCSLRSAKIAGACSSDRPSRKGSLLEAAHVGAGGLQVTVKSQVRNAKHTPGKGMICCQ